MNNRHITLINILLKAAMAFVLFIMVSYLSIRHYRTFDFTESGLYSLSPKTKKVLQALDKDIEITVFFQEVHQIYDDLKTILDVYSQKSPHIKIKYIDPDKDVAKFKQISSKYNIETMALLIVESGNSMQYVKESDLAHIAPGDVMGKQVSYIAGLKIESSMTAAILSVMSERRKKIYFSTGHGENTLANEEADGLFKFADLLKKDNYDVKNISLMGIDTIPSDCSLLFIAGAKIDFSEKEFLLISNYLKGGGSLFVALDPLSKTNMNDFLERYGVRRGDNIVVDPAKRVAGRSAANLYLDKYGDHVITDMLNNVAVLFYLASSVDIVKTSDKMNVDVSPLLFTSEHGWGETDTANNNFSLDKDKDLTGPVSVAAVVAENRNKGFKLALFGDADFMTTDNIKLVGNPDILLNTVNWLADNESLISANVKQKEKVFLSLNAKELNKILFMVILFIPGVFVLAGIVVWFNRRK